MHSKTVPTRWLVKYRAPHGMKSISAIQHNTLIIYDLIEVTPESCTILQMVTQYIDGHQVYYSVLFIMKQPNHDILVYWPILHIKLHNSIISSECTAHMVKCTNITIVEQHTAQTLQNKIVSCMEMTTRTRKTLLEGGGK